MPPCWGALSCSANCKALSTRSCLLSAMASFCRRWIVLCRFWVQKRTEEVRSAHHGRIIEGQPDKVRHCIVYINQVTIVEHNSGGHRPSEERWEENIVCVNIW